MTDPSEKAAQLPPKWLVRSFWRIHRALYRLTGGRLLWTPASKRGWGALHLTTIGRHSGKPRSVIVGYLQDGPNYVTLAMNGWEEGHPAWWLNLTQHPEAIIRLSGQPSRAARVRAATGEERERLWQQWSAVNPELGQFAQLRQTPTPVVVIEPRD